MIGRGMEICKAARPRIQPFRHPPRTIHPSIVRTHPRKLPQDLTAREASLGARALPPSSNPAEDREEVQTHRRSAMKNPIHLPLVLLIAALGYQSQVEAQIPPSMRPAARNTITVEEIARNPQTDLHAYLARKRPLWLNTRGPVGAGSSGVVVYVDGMRRGGVEELRSIPLDIVDWVGHFTGPEASLRWGMGHSHGAIYVATGLSGSARAG